MNYDEFFAIVTGQTKGPFGYQRRLAQEPWPDLLDVPTGLGKTAAVIVGWLYKRLLLREHSTPRRLVYCLPMRVLVEQTVECASRWADAAGEVLGVAAPRVHVLMGGSDDVRKPTWSETPESNAILIGTQDMLLSRALMRGYGMSRYQWPVQFALLHNDALWVFDEVQLMGAGLVTSAQLEGLRRKIGGARSCRSLWLSATLNPMWLQTVDFREFSDQLKTIALSGTDQSQEAVQTRLSARKRLVRARTTLSEASGKQHAAAYIDALADEVADAHREGEQTLIVVNRVERAQSLYRALAARLPNAEHILVHARFRPPDRKRIEQSLKGKPGHTGRVIVATQAVEAGVDISSRVLFSELAPWSSLVQRFGRCNRYGEHTEADVYWVDIDDAAEEAAPYESDSLAEARHQLASLAEAGPGSLPSVTEELKPTQTLRRRDLLELFNTDPDLSGFDVDVSAYIRDPGAAQAQVFWRDFSDRPDDELQPQRDELCPVGLGQMKDYLGKKGRAAWIWDPLTGHWERFGSERLRPGLILLLRARDGGYRSDEGFLAREKNEVESPEFADGQCAEQYGADRWSEIGRYIRLTDHLLDVTQQAASIAQCFGLEEREADLLIETCRWHDVGKAHEAFQRGIRGDDCPDEDILWAKSKRGGRPDYHVLDTQGHRVARTGFRHELASALAWLDHASGRDDLDLIAFLIAAHHGKVRMGLRALPIECQPPDPDTLYARGIWDGDCLPSVAIDDFAMPETVLHLDVMQLGLGRHGPSWTERTRHLLDQYGPFRLAWLEALVRIVDWRASRSEREEGS